MSFFYFLFVDVDADDVIAHLGETGIRRYAYVTCADYAQFHYNSNRLYPLKNAVILLQNKKLLPTF